MNTTEQKLYDMTNAYLGFGHNHILQSEVDSALAICAEVLKDELQDADTYNVQKALYEFWNCRNDDYGLNDSERYIYVIAKTILQGFFPKKISAENVLEAMEDAIALGTGRRINGEYDYELVKSRLYNWFDVRVAE